MLTHLRGHGCMRGHRFMRGGTKKLRNVIFIFSCKPLLQNAIPLLYHNRVTSAVAAAQLAAAFYSMPDAAAQ